MNKKTQILKKYFNDKKTYKIPTCHDPLSIKLIEKKGFKIGFIGGFALSSASFGYPDASVISRKELVESTKLICNQSKIPIIVDADTGFGDLKNVFKTVKDLSHAGASALILEDQVFPKICALTGKVKLLDMKNASKRIKTAIKASKKTKGILIIARTDALTTNSIKEAVNRANLYKKLGADAIFITGINNTKQADLISKEVKNIPLFINITEKIKFNMNKIKKSSFKFILYSQQVLNSYVDSTNQTLDLIKKNKIPKFKNKASATLNLLELKKYLKIKQN